MTPEQRQSFIEQTSQKLMGREITLPSIQQVGEHIQFEANTARFLFQSADNIYTISANRAHGEFDKSRVGALIYCAQRLAESALNNDEPACIFFTHACHTLTESGDVLHPGLKYSDGLAKTAQQIRGFQSLGDAGFPDIFDNRTMREMVIAGILKTTEGKNSNAQHHRAYERSMRSMLAPIYFMRFHTKIQEAKRSSDLPDALTYARIITDLQSYGEFNQFHQLSAQRFSYLERAIHSAITSDYVPLLQWYTHELLEHAKLPQEVRNQDILNKYKKLILKMLSTSLLLDQRCTPEYFLQTISKINEISDEFPRTLLRMMVTINQYTHATGVREIPENFDLEKAKAALISSIEEIGVEDHYFTPGSLGRPDVYSN